MERDEMLTEPLELAAGVGLYPLDSDDLEAMVEERQRQEAEESRKPTTRKAG